MSILKTTELYILKERIFWYMNSISIELFFKKRKKRRYDGGDDPVLVNFHGLTQWQVSSHVKHHQWCAGDQECGVRGGSVPHSDSGTQEDRGSSQLPSGFRGCPGHSHPATGPRKAQGRGSQWGSYGLIERPVQFLPCSAG